MNVIHIRINSFKTFNTILTKVIALKQQDILSPTKTELENTVLDIIRHSLHVEYYCNQLNVGSEDLQRPHDISGDGNKFELSVLYGLAIAKRDDSEDYFDKYILPSIQKHRRGQTHHIMNMYNSQSSQDQIDIATIDAICSRTEHREYQEDISDFAKLIKMFKKSERGYQVWAKSCWKISSSMGKIRPPNLDYVVSIDNFPNVGVDNKIYERILLRVDETIHGLRLEGYDF